MNEAAIQRELDAHGRRLDDHGRSIDSLMEFRAEVRGSLRTLSIIATTRTEQLTSRFSS